jgi:hypothetical protein
MLEPLEQAAQGAQQALLDQVDLQHPHNRRAVQANVGAQVEEEVSLW